MVLFLRYAVEGLATGFVVGLLALSVVMIYRSTRVLSFAQGVIASLSTYFFYQTGTVWKWPTALAMLIALTGAIGLGVLCDVTVMRPLRKANALTRTVATLGIVLVLQVVMRVIWKGRESFVPPLARGRIEIGQFSMGYQQLIIAAVAVVAAVVLAAWTRRSYTGLGLSAIADDIPAARLLGVSPGRSSTITWSASAVLAGLAGILFTPLLVLNPWQMTLVMVTSFGAALTGGFMSLPMALFGGLVIGVVQSEATGYIQVSGLSETFGFIAVFAVLLMTKGRKGSSLASRGATAW